MLETKVKAVADLAQLFEEEASSGALENVDETLVTVSDATEDLFEKAEQDYLCK
jgi:hypothetical protein